MKIFRAGKTFFLLAGIIFVLLMFTSLSVHADTAVRIQVDGEIIKTDAEPVIENGRTIVPVATIIENIGGTSSWDGSNSQVTLEYEGTVVKMWIGSKKATVNGVSKTLDVAPRIVTVDANGGGRTMIPIRFVAENFSCKVDWDDAERLVLIDTPDTGVPKLKVEYTSIYTGQKYGKDTSKTYTLVKFKANQVIKNKGYKTVSLIDPDRCYVDVADSIIGTDAAKTKTVNSSTSYVKSVRTGAPTVYNSRIVVDLKATVKPEISYSDDGKTMILAFPETYTGGGNEDVNTDPDSGMGAEEEEEIIIPYEPYADGQLVVCLDPGHGMTTGGKRSP
ncbi:MAG: AMIN domain-containing protein, partial [Firmicutes bacterium]|nr:AMIN domain-containing protein [Bacillota bacterium]